MKAPFLKWLIELAQDYMYYRDFERFWNSFQLDRPTGLPPIRRRGRTCRNAARSQT